MPFVEYVDSQGEVQYVDDPALLPAAASSLGLLGIVTAITYKVLEFRGFYHLRKGMLLYPWF